MSVIDPKLRFHKNIPPRPERTTLLHPVDRNLISRTQKTRPQKKKKEGKPFLNMLRTPKERISFLSIALAFQTLVSPGPGGGSRTRGSISMELGGTPGLFGATAFISLNPLIPLSAHDDVAFPAPIRCHSLGALLFCALLPPRRYEPFNSNTVRDPFQRICNAIPVCRQDPPWPPFVHQTPSGIEILTVPLPLCA